MKHLTEEFDKIEFVQTPRSQNMVADEVVKIASSKEGTMSSMGFVMEIQKRPSIEEVPTFTIQSTNNWMTPIVSFLQDRHLPQNAEEAKKIKRPDLRSLMTPYTREASPCLT